MLDVLICGYGPTGAVAANLLGRMGVSTLAVDQSPEIFDTPRAVHFDGEVMRILQGMGLEDELRAVSSGGESVAFLNARGRELLALDMRDFEVRHAWPPGNFFNQPQLEAHLRAAARALPSVEARLGWELTGFEQDEDGVTVALRAREGGRTETVRARYLLGCDGATGPTRELAGLPVADLDSDEPWLVCDVYLDEGVEIRRRVYQFCDPRRPATLVPCVGRHVRWEFKVNPGDDPATLEQEDTVRGLMAPYLHLMSETLTPEQGTLARSKVYDFHGLLAERWRAGRVFVLGDAAHQMPPFLGQGLCTGVRDALNLCWKLEGVLAGRYHDALLDTYESERRPHARAVVEQAIRTGKVIQARNRFVGGLRDTYFSLANWIPLLRRPFLWEPAWPLGPGLFEPAAPPTAKSAHGNPIDQPVVADASGARVPLDRLLGDGFAVVGLDTSPAEALDAETAKALEPVGATRVAVTRPGRPGTGDAVDVDGGLAGWFRRVGGGRVALVRPDRQVFGVYGHSDGAPLGSELRSGVAALLGGLGIRPAA